MTYTINLNIKSILDNTENFTDAKSNIIIKKYNYNNTDYNIIKYNKKNLNELKNDEAEFNNLKNLRSVIVRDNKIVCFSPPKSVDYNKFVNKYADTSEIWAEDFVDGTMINVFYDHANKVWEIATKSTVGGNIVFFNDVKNYKYFDDNNYFSEHYDLTFRSMFFETCNSNNFNLNTLNTNYCYSFIMQHPFNRIVTPIVTATIYLVKVYNINSEDLTNVTVKEINISSFVNCPPHIFLNTNVKFINKYPFSSYQDIKAMYNSDNTPYYCMGCVINSDDGIRSKIRNNNYEMVRQLRGNQPKLQYNYLNLRKNNKINEFLSYYPEHSLIFNKFRLALYSYTNELFANYISCFIRKEKPLKEYVFAYKTHMYYLHELYKSELRPNKQNVDKKVVINYINSLEPAQLMFVINNANSGANDDETNHETLRTTTGNMTDLSGMHSPKRLRRGGASGEQPTSVDTGNDCTNVSGMQNDDNHEDDDANDEMNE
jgi:hypothetical protein